MSSVRELYQEIILDHNRNPRNFRRMDDCSKQIEGYNPLCGDHYTIYLKIAGGVIADVSFEGNGCAISKASASVMSTVLKGKTVREADELFDKFHRLVTGSAVTDADVEALGKLAAFSGVSGFPARVKCASLAWHTMHAALSTDATKVTTE
ncbi:MAG TPA: SUF system NifU family Fe-S cluster assembly protein [Bacteroidota bacterium]|nr:SUF system NifU family Fe-S cluster assembly protein [Bacteroidota bacterium]